MESTDAKLVDLWIERKAQAQDYRGLFENKWIYRWQAYRNTLTTPRLRGQFWTHNEMLPDAFKVIETIIPQHVLGMYRDPNWFSVEAPSVAGRTYQLSVKSLLNRGWRQADMFSNSITTLKYTAIMGHSTPKLYWNTKVRDYAGEEVGQTDAGPHYELPDLFNTWLDPTGKENWVVERIDGSVEELKARNKEFGGALYKNLTKVPFSKVEKSRYYGSDNSTPSEIVDGISRTMTQSPDHVDLWQCWGLVPESIKRYEDTQWRMQVIANGDVLIRDVPVPPCGGKTPYINTQAVPIPHQIYGDSVLSWIMPLIKRKSFIENCRHDEILLNMFQQWIIDESAGYSPNNMLRQPGGAAVVSPGYGKTLRDIMFPVPRTPVLPESFMEASAKSDEINRTSGSTDHFQGQGLGSRASATEASMVAQASGGRHALQTMWLDETFKRPLLERMFKMFQTRMDQPQTVEFDGMRDQITMADLQWDVDIYVDSGKLGSFDQQQMNGLVQLLGVLGNNPQTAAYLNYGEISRDLFYRLGLSEAQRYVRSDDEVAAQMAQQQKQELMQAALSGRDAGAAQTGATPDR